MEATATTADEDFSNGISYTVNDDFNNWLRYIKIDTEDATKDVDQEVLTFSILHNGWYDYFSLRTCKRDNIGGSTASADDIKNEIKMHHLHSNLI